MIFNANRRFVLDFIFILRLEDFRFGECDFVFGECGPVDPVRRKPGQFLSVIRLDERKEFLDGDDFEAVFAEQFFHHRPPLIVAEQVMQHSEQALTPNSFEVVILALPMEVQKGIPPSDRDGPTGIRSDIEIEFPPFPPRILFQQFGGVAGEVIVDPKRQFSGGME